ncbi:hypothetical protein BGZ51_006182 [Haplosporangium sp. Z 767]|nr:hypothetical protein BGZ51_006182 [Haplosporangium sp. Z 767]
MPCFGHVPIFYDYQKNQLSDAAGQDPEVLEALTYTRWNVMQQAQLQALEESEIVQGTDIRQTKQSTYDTLSIPAAEAPPCDPSSSDRHPHGVLDKNGNRFTGVDIISSNNGVHIALLILLATLFEGTPFICQYVDQMRNDEHFMSFFVTENDTKKILSDECFASRKLESPVKDEHGVQLAPDRIAQVFRRGTYYSFVDTTPSSDFSDFEDMKYEDDEEEIDCDEQDADPIMDVAYRPSNDTQTLSAEPNTVQAKPDDTNKADSPSSASARRKSRRVTVSLPSAEHSRLQTREQEQLTRIRNEIALVERRIAAVVDTIKALEEPALWTTEQTSRGQPYKVIDSPLFFLDSFQSYCKNMMGPNFQTSCHRLLIMATLEGITRQRLDRDLHKIPADEMS